MVQARHPHGLGWYNTGRHPRTQMGCPDVSESNRHPHWGNQVKPHLCPHAEGTGLHSPAWHEPSYPHSSEAEHLNLEPVPSLDLHSVNVWQQNSHLRLLSPLMKRVLQNQSSSELFHSFLPGWVELDWHTKMPISLCWLARQRGIPPKMLTSQEMVISA